MRRLISGLARAKAKTRRLLANVQSGESKRAPGVDRVQPTVGLTYNAPLEPHAVMALVRHERPRKQPA